MSGVIHGDLNGQNVLVERRMGEEYDISGIIDFGESHWSPYVAEVSD